MSRLARVFLPYVRIEGPSSKTEAKKKKKRPSRRPQSRGPQKESTVFRPDKRLHAIAFDGCCRVLLEVKEKSTDTAFCQRGWGESSCGERERYKTKHGGSTTLQETLVYYYLWTFLLRKEEKKKSLYIYTDLGEAKETVGRTFAADGACVMMCSSHFVFLPPRCRLYCLSCELPRPVLFVPSKKNLRVL